MCIRDSDKVGYVTRFDVKKSVSDKYQPEIVGAREHEEIWVPAEELTAFNEAIVGKIRVIAKYEQDELVWEKWVKPQI